MSAPKVLASHHPPRAVLGVFCPICAAALQPGRERWTCGDCARGWTPDEVQKSILDVSADLLALLAGRVA